MKVKFADPYGCGNFQGHQGKQQVMCRIALRKVFRYYCETTCKHRGDKK